MDKKPTATELKCFRIPNIREEAAALTLRAKEEKNRERLKSKMKTTMDEEKPSVYMIGNQITNLQQLVASDTAHRLSQKSLASRRRRQRHSQKKYRERVKLRLKATQRTAELKDGISKDQQCRVDRIVKADSDGRDEETLKQIGKDTVSRMSMKTLQPGEWLSDEVMRNSSSALPS